VSGLPDQAVECVPNVSEGRRADVIQQLCAVAAGVAGAYLLDVHSDPDHHRSVFTIVGSPAAVAEAVFRLGELAVLSIDMRAHRGVHPRIGALDVAPFVPLGQTTMNLCVGLAHALGRRIATELGTPVYFYGEAALGPERKSLADVRRGEYEGLLGTIGTDPSRAPDLGPASLGPAGATAVGARPPLVAFNMHLRSSDVNAAREIARAVRASSGGLPGVQALGLPTSRPGLVQVSINVTDLAETPLHVVTARVQAEAQRIGVELAESELVGLMPAESSLAAAAALLALPGLKRTQIIESAYEDAARRATRQGEAPRP